LAGEEIENVVDTPQDDTIIGNALDNFFVTLNRRTSCHVPNHWHFVLWPENDGDLGAFSGTPQANLSAGMQYFNGSYTLG